MNHAAQGGWVHSDTSNPAGRGVLEVPDSLSLRIAGPHRQATAPAPDWKRHSGVHRSQPRLGPSPRSQPQSRSERGPPSTAQRLAEEDASPQRELALTGGSSPTSPASPLGSQPHQELPKRKDLCGSGTPARQGAGPADARPFTRASLTPPEAGTRSFARHPSVALTSAGAVGVEKPQVLRRGGGRHGRQEHEELVSVSDLYLRIKGRGRSDIPTYPPPRILAPHPPATWGRHHCPHGITRIYENSGVFCPTTEYLEKYPMYDNVLPAQSLKPKQEIRACRGKMEGITTFKLDYHPYEIFKQPHHVPEEYKPKQGKIDLGTTYKRDFNSYKVRPVTIVRPLERQQVKKGKLDTVPTYKVLNQPIKQKSYQMEKQNITFTLIKDKIENEAFICKQAIPDTEPQN
ncbi:hypothetical protein H8959_016842 [Pygathrix nigripes]